MRRHTIGKYYLEFYEYSGDIGGNRKSITEMWPVYEGPSKDIDSEIAIDIAEIHPNHFEYVEQAMMPLYKGYSGRLRSRTENPKLAISSKSKLPFVRIFKLS